MDKALIQHDPAFTEESERLSWTQEKFAELIVENKEFFDSLPALYPGDHYILNELLTMTHNRIAKLERSGDKPYFARIDFRESDKEDVEQLYLGKIGVVDGEERLVVLDWRAPVSTLYYDSNVGEVSYDSPGGIVAGDLKLKRQIEIEEGKLISCGDVDTVANDELLQPYLGVNADNRLKNIIATIQSEQNRIIRERLDVNLVVQGAAGSGKTTVALHRIAYLAYHHRDSVKAGQYMVIGPNRFFISYISAVLPDLDVDSVPQCTYEELVKDALGEAYQVTDKSIRLGEVVAGRDSGAAERFKTSMDYKEALDRFISEFEETFLPSGDFAVKGFTILEEQELREAWDQARAGAGETVKAKVEQCILFLNRRILDRMIEYSALLSERFRGLYREEGANLDRLHKDRTLIERELEKGCVTSLRSYLNKCNMKILPLYRQFILECEKYVGDFPDVELLKKRTIANLRKKQVDSEDQPALLYLLTRMRGVDRYRDFRHAVVDEAQDFGEFDFYALQNAMHNCYFTVVGDLAQTIYSYRGIENWNKVLENSFDRGAKLLEMSKSYRTTVEVMEAANRVSDVLGLSPAVPVIRHGSPVEYYSMAGENAIEKIGELVQGYQAEGYKSIAILDKNGEGLSAIRETLISMGIEVEAAAAGDGQYSGGVCVLPCYLSKGLEFDCVILLDAAEKIYRSDRRIDMHLLYVAMTRPLHKLDIFHSGQLTAPLREL